MASVRSGAPARSAGPRDARAMTPARRRRFPGTRVAAGAGTVTRVASKRRAGPGWRTTRSRRTRRARRAVPARAPAMAQAPAMARAPAKARSGGRTGGGPGSRTGHRTGWSWGSRTRGTCHPGCPPGAVRLRGACLPPGPDLRRFAFRRHHRSRLSPNRDRSDIPPSAVPFPTLLTYQSTYPHRLCVGGHFTRPNQVSGRAVGGIGAGSRAVPAR